MSAADTPLSSFMISLSESPDLLERYQDEDRRASLLAEHELADHPAFSRHLSVNEMQAHVQAEHPGQANVRLAGWIKIGKLPWILKAPTEDEPEKPEPPPPPPPPPKDPKE